MIIFDDTSYGGSFTAAGSGTADGAAYVVAASGSLSATIELNADGSVTGTWSFTGSYTAQITPEGEDTFEDSGPVGGGGTVSGTPGALVFVGSDFLVSGTGSLSANYTGISASFNWSLDGASGGASGSFAGDPVLINDYDPPPMPTDLHASDVAVVDNPTVTLLSSGGAQYVGPNWHYLAVSDRYELQPGGHQYTTDQVAGVTSEAMTLFGFAAEAANLPGPIQQVLATGSVAAQLWSAVNTLTNDVTNTVLLAAQVGTLNGASIDTVEAAANSAHSNFATNLADIVFGAYVDATLSAISVLTPTEAYQVLLHSAQAIKIAAGYSDVFFTYQSGSEAMVLPLDHHNKVIGSPLDDTIVAGNLGDVIFAGLGNDTLVGGTGGDLLVGGGGSDSLAGGLGDDLYHVDTQADLIFEGVDQGIDSVLSKASFYLYANIENLTLDGTGDLFGVGNGVANTITGNTGANLLYGLDGSDTLNGNAGIDYLIGGIGDDTLNGGADSDALYGEDGHDTLWGGDGFFTDILSAGAGNDTLYGNSGLNEQDYLDGNAGDDTYYVDTTWDLTFEAEGGGTDTVYADVSNVPNAGVYLWGEVENLVLVGTTAYGVGNGLNNTLTGSASGNWLLGGAGNDTLNGKGGDDVLFGEAGSDTFVFETGSGGDVIGDFNAAEDTINLDAYNFASFAQLQTAFVQNGDHGAINLGGGNFIVLHNTTMASLDAGDFVL